MGRDGTLNDKLSLQITSIKLNGSNYLPWSLIALLAIQSRDLPNYLTGETEEPKLRDLSHS